MKLVEGFKGWTTGPITGPKPSVESGVGTMARDSGGKLAMTRVTLHPAVSYSGDKRPSRAEEDALHHAAHEACFIASSVKTEVTCKPAHSPD